MMQTPQVCVCTLLHGIGIDLPHKWTVLSFTLHGIYGSKNPISNNCLGTIRSYKVLSPRVRRIVIVRLVRT
jgi:hypothetical protein